MLNIEKGKIRKKKQNPAERECNNIVVTTTLGISDNDNVLVTLEWPRTMTLSLLMVSRSTEIHENGRSQDFDTTNSDSSTVVPLLQSHQHFAIIVNP